MNNQKIITQSVSSSLFYLSWPTTVVIISPTSREKLDSASQQILNRVNQHVISTKDLSFNTILDTIQQDHSQVKTVVAIGGGTAIDYAKYTAKHLNLECIAIPSMLSTNAFATDKVAVYSNGSKHTELGKLPDTIVLSQDYLNQSKQENLYGLVDVFSIYNALRDWEYAQNLHGDTIDIHIWSRAHELLKSALDVAWNYISEKTLNMDQLFHVIQEAGYITNDYGSGRPESGSEHIFASALESQIKIPHALSVTLGMHIMEFLNKTISKVHPVGAVSSFDNLPFRQLGLIDNINAMELSFDLIYNTIRSLQPRSDKFTMVDLLNPTEVDRHELSNYLEHHQFKFI